MQTTFGITGLLLLSIIVGVIIYIVRKAHDIKRQQSLVFLQVLIPKKETKEDKEEMSEQFSSNDFREFLGVMDHLYQSIYSIYNSGLNRLWKGQGFLSLEYAALDGEILFVICCPRKIFGLVEKQLTSFYPDAVVDEVEDYNIFTPESYVASKTIHPEKKFSHAFMTYNELKTDPLNAITNAFSKITKTEGAAVQFMIQPVKNNWQPTVHKQARAIINPKSSSKFKWYNPLSWLASLWTAMFNSDQFNQDLSSNKEQDRVSNAVEEYSKALDTKASGPGYKTSIRLVASADTIGRADAILNSISSGFTQFANIRGNSFTSSNMNSNDTTKRFVARNPHRTFYQMWRYPTMLLGTPELASLFHFPISKFNKVDNIKWQKSSVAPAPKDIPEEGLYLGTNVYRGQKKQIYMKNEDRFRHFYIIGQTGTGKSSIQQLMARQDFHNGKGLCVVDPHGSLIEDLMPYIPRERADDVIYFNPADTERPMGLNLLEAQTDEEMDLIALDAMNMMIKMFGSEVFGPRIQDYFRNGVLTLMSDKEEGGAITDLVKLFTDEEWQKYKVSKVQNPIVKNFWTKQMAQTGAREKGEMIPYFAAKFGQFYTNKLIRNIVGQTRSAFDIGKCMDEGKILLMNLSKGLIGDINANLLGMIAVQKIQVAAMRRQSQESSARRDFFLYIDEFQNFVTDSIESILSEARKYRLGLVLAHQYIDQLENKDKMSGGTNLKGAIFGNVGTMMCYKIGPDDSEVMAKQMAPVYSDQDLVNLEAFKAAMKLTVNGQAGRPFNLDVPKPWLDKTFVKDTEAAEAFKQLSRLTYGRQKDFVDKEILRRIG